MKTQSQVESGEYNLTRVISAHCSVIKRKAGNLDSHLVAKQMVRATVQVHKKYGLSHREILFRIVCQLAGINTN